MSHPALQLPEILALVCEVFQNRSSTEGLRFYYQKYAAETQANRTTLCAVARTNKAFSEPALNTLWSVLPNLDPLISLLPKYTKLSGGRESWFPRRLTTEDLSPADWIRFNLYAPKVRKIEGHHRSGHASNTMLPWMLSLQDQTGPSLLPQLRYLNFRMELPFGIVYPGIFVGAGLLELDVGGEHPKDLPLSQDIMSWIPSLPERSPGLQCLWLKWPSISLLDQITIAHTVLRLKALKTLELKYLDAPLSREALSALTALPVLEELSLQFGGNEINSWAIDEENRLRSDAATAASFQSLHELTLSVNLESSHLLDILQSFFLRAPLRTLSITDEREDPDDSFQPVSEWLGSHYSSTLVHVGIDTPSRYDARPLGMAVLRPLFRCPGVRHLSLECRIDLGDDDLLEIGRAWSGLTHLQILPRFMRIPLQPRVTLPGIRELTRLCPALRLLGTAVDMRAPAPASESQPTDVTVRAPPSLRQLFITPNSLIDNAHETFAFMRQTWPALNRLPRDGLWKHRGDALKQLLQLDELLEKGVAAAA